MRRLLLLEDNEDFALSLKRGLSGRFEVVHAKSIPEARVLMRQPAAAVLVDLFLNSEGEGEPEGIGFVRWLAKAWPHVPSIVITGFDRAGLDLKALKIGASDFVVKGSNFSVKELTARIDAAVERKLRDKESGSSQTEPLVLAGDSRPVVELRRVLRISAQDASARIVLRGEVGTRKDLVAHEFAEMSVNRLGPFIAVDCRADLSAEDILSAVDAAWGGVLFLDEVTLLLSEAQKGLLACIDRIQVGADNLTENFQIVSSASRDLDEAVRDGLISADIRGTLGTLEVRVPPLRERVTDIRFLVSALLAQTAIDGSLTNPVPSDEVWTLLENHIWPGNIRELLAVLDVAVVRARASRSHSLRLEHFTDVTSGIKARKEGVSDTAGVFERLSWYELSLVEDALIRCHGRKDRARVLLGYPSRHTMRRRLEGLYAKFPELWAQFPNIVEAYGAGEAEHS